MDVKSKLKAALNSGGTKLVAKDKKGNEVQEITVGTILDAKLGDCVIHQKHVSAKDEITKLFFGEKSKGSWKEYKELFEMITEAYKRVEGDSTGTTKASFKKLNEELFGN